MPTEEEVAAAERQLTKVCLRGHQVQQNTKAGILDTDAFKELTTDRCPTCGAFWLYATDGQKMLGLVNPIKGVPNGNPESPEHHPA